MRYDRDDGRGRTPFRDGMRDRAGYRSSGRDERARGYAGYDRPPSDYDYEERGFMDRAGDEVRSWFGDEEAERRRRYDDRYGRSDSWWGQGAESAYGTGGYAQGRSGAYRGDTDYDRWRREQIAALDRDYDDYRRENQTRFNNEFGSWRSQRLQQRASLNEVAEHMEVIGSDGEHVGTVDGVRGDRIVLTKSDRDSGGHHHSIPCSWIQSVDERVTIAMTADQVQSAWRDEERNQAMFGNEGTTGPHILNRSFSGTY